MRCLGSFYGAVQFHFDATILRLYALNFDSKFLNEILKKKIEMAMTADNPMYSIRHEYNA